MLCLDAETVRNILDGKVTSLSIPVEPQPVLLESGWSWTGIADDPPFPWWQLALEVAFGAPYVAGSVVKISEPYRIVDYDDYTWVGVAPKVRRRDNNGMIWYEAVFYKADLDTGSHRAAKSMPEWASRLSLYVHGVGASYREGTWYWELQFDVIN